ncbi:cytochrome P450 oxidoreductase [Cladophialophora carrionii]|uniref:Cytochrome P450 oxidoreductase n=1 Tax=Cladophialophora carrionii TaxID=86049 RepID=A0A1C1CLS9_9EURO|nr:cytochrome P450 oxidoreductase [Cladophialophora carrionii]
MTPLGGILNLRANALDGQLLGIRGYAAIGLYLSLAFLLYRMVQTIYRLYFHPLRHFLGPKEACVSEAWLYHVTKKGAPNEVFEALHRKYKCRALRVAPNELHIDDVSLYKVIYNQLSPFPKSPAFYAAFNIPHTVFTETDPSKHKERRRLLNSLFSRSGALRLEPVIRTKLFSVGEKIDRLCVTKPVDTYDAFRLLTTEVILEFAFARSANMITEHADSFKSWFLDAFDVASQSIFDMQYRPFVRHLAGILPSCVIRVLNPNVGTLLDVIKFAGESLHHFKQRSSLPDHPVVFDSLKGLPDRDGVSEAQDILVAGADTTAFTLTTGIMHIVSNPDVQQKLTSSLLDAIDPDGEFPTLLTLERIEYLTACVKESLRVGMAVPGRLPRVVPWDRAKPFVVDGKIVPPGTIVSMTAYTMHTSTEAWGPDARLFRPERWLGPESQGLDQYLCTFSKGTRMCLGQNIASAEITIALAYIFSKYRLSLPKDFEFPQKEDRFTYAYLSPGASISFSKRGKTRS